MFDTLQLTPSRIILFGLLLVGIASVRGCEPVPPEYQAFFAQDWDRQREQGKKFPIEKQIDYYLAGRKYVHPPSSIMLYVIAERGKSAVPALLERMQKENSDAAKENLMKVVRNIHDFHDDLRSEKETLEQFKAIAADMKDAKRKARVEEMLTDIVENRRPAN